MECTEGNQITGVWTFNHSESDHACFDHLSRKRAQITALERKSFDHRSLSPALPNLQFLLVVIIIIIITTPTITFVILLSRSLKSRSSSAKYKLGRTKLKIHASQI